MPSTAKVIPLGDSFFEVIRAQRALGLAGDIQSLGSMNNASPGLAGASGRVADAAHRHPALISDTTNPALEIQQTVPGYTWALLVNSSSFVLQDVSAGLNRLVANTTGQFGLGLGNAPVAAGRILNIVSDHAAFDAIQFQDNNAAPWDTWLAGLSPGGSPDTNSFGFYDLTKALQVLRITGAAPTGLTLPQPSAYIKLVDSSATPNKWLRASGGAFQLLNSAFSVVLASIDENSIVSLNQPAGAVIFNNGTGIIRGTVGHVTSANNLQLSHDNVDIAAQVETTNAFTVNPSASSSRGLSVGGFQVIPVIYVQSTTPTEVDGALWFQG